LELVDTVFAGDAGSAMHNRSEHKAFHENKPGRIDIWPFIDPETKPDPDVWYRPLDLPAPNDPRQDLARRIADNLDVLLQSGQQLEVEGVKRPVSAGDILILVQNRGPLFNAILKELKSKELPVAGADRLNVGEELAVRDILSLLKFAAMADDDLSLAEAMRSPLLGFSEGDLFHVAHGRDGTLWQSLRSATGYNFALDILHDIRKQVDYLRPYELIERLLINHKGREHLLARLGPEIEDGIDELLSQALQYETLEAPTLTGFLHWFESGKVEIKRDMGMSANQIRLMTVHGAKGLEAPIVILPDTASKRPQNRSQITAIGDSAIWRSSSADAAETQSAADVTQKEREQAEKMRLLYVALTRAESWLIICGAGERSKDGKCWYDLVSQAILSLNSNGVDFPNIGPGHSLQNEQWELLGSAKPAHSTPASITQVPNWMTAHAPKHARPAQPLSPSKLGGAKALPSSDALPEEQAKHRGRLLHKLLEYLPTQPPDDWLNYGQRLLTDEPDSQLTNALITEAVTLLQNPNLHHIFFDTNSMTEVGITAPVVGTGENMMGYIDRLIITDSIVLAVDFKSNAGIPDTIEQTPAGILAQQGAYLMALEQIYPDHHIDIAILWTRTGQIMSIPHNIAMNALQASLHLDDPRDHS
jgi:ATP-dependent helicase/nuclease subunit A